MSKHTPGPWTAVIEKDDERVVDTYVVDADEDVVVRPSAKLSEGDARLIAAAPDLLAACKLMLAAPKNPLDPLSDASTKRFVKTYHKMRAAIAKAEGEGP